MTQETIRQILRDIDSSLAAKDDAFIDRWISYAITEVRVTLFGDENNIDYQKAIAYLTASKIQASVLGSKTSSNYSTGSGGLKRKKAGNVELEYFASSSSGSQSTQTQNNTDIYLQEYKKILNRYGRSNIILEHSF